MSHLIINADDFGRSRKINEAVITAHRAGILTSASLMVTGDAFDEAVELARENNKLAVGLHLVLVQGRAALEACRIPALVDADGRFDTNPLRAGVRYFFSAAARRELAAEIAAQFERFASTGLPLSHVDGHLHMHVHPAIFPSVLTLARQYGASGLRLPREPLWPALSCQLKGPASKLAQYIAFRLLSLWCARRLRGSMLNVPRYSCGLLMSGQMRESYVSALIAGNRAASEIYFHPTCGPRVDALGPNRGDFQTLLCPRIAGLAYSRGVRLTNYAGLAEWGAAP